MTPRGTRVVIEDEYADGKKTRVETLVIYDGKPRPSTGSGIWDSTATKRIDRNVAEAELIRDGKAHPPQNLMRRQYDVASRSGTEHQMITRL